MEISQFLPKSRFDLINTSGGVGVGAGRCITIQGHGGRGRRLSHRPPRSQRGRELNQPRNPPEKTHAKRQTLQGPRGLQGCRADRTKRMRQARATTRGRCVANSRLVGRACDVQVTRSCAHLYATGSVSRGRDFGGGRFQGSCLAPCFSFVPTVFGSILEATDDAG